MTHGTDRRELIEAMRWLRSQRPEEAPFLRVIHHGWFGHCVWSTYHESGCLMLVRDLREQYRRSKREGER